MVSLGTARLSHKARAWLRQIFRISRIIAMVIFGANGCDGHASACTARSLQKGFLIAAEQHEWKERVYRCFSEESCLSMGHSAPHAPFPLQQPFARASRRRGSRPQRPSGEACARGARWLAPLGGGPHPGRTTSRGALHLLRVAQALVTFEDGQDDTLARAREQAIREARTSLTRLEREIQTAALARDGLPVGVAVEVGADTLLRVVARRGRKGAASCQVMGLSTHGRSGLERWVMGSVAERVLDATGLPLLIVRARAE